MRKLVGILLGITALVAASTAAWLMTLPTAPEQVATPQPISQSETDATLAALKPPKRSRPVIAVLGINDATEVTDYLMPYGILKSADVADVLAVATEPGPVQLFPALRVEPEATVAEFDARYPEGADYVIVPAMTRDNDPAALAWLKTQSAAGATIIGICAGTMVVADAGLLDGKRGTTHWYSVQDLRDDHAAMTYVPDRRFVVEEGIATTTGISASMPMMLTLIEAIAGGGKAQAVAADLGASTWDARHNSKAFDFTRPFAVTAMGNLAAFWKRENIGIELTAGMDEVSLALVADAWSRTYRSSSVTFAASDAPITMRGGLRILPDEVATAWPADRTVAAQQPGESASAALDRTLDEINQRYGADTRDFVAMQLEYPLKPAP